MPKIILTPQPGLIGVPSNPEVGALIINPGLRDEQEPEIDSGNLGTKGVGQGTSATIENSSVAVGASEGDSGSGGKGQLDAGGHGDSEIDAGGKGWPPGNDAIAN
jgi:hypothetical protein